MQIFDQDNLASRGSLLVQRMAAYSAGMLPFLVSCCPFGIILLIGVRIMSDELRKFTAHYQPEACDRIKTGLKSQFVSYMKNKLLDITTLIDKVSCTYRSRPTRVSLIRPRIRLSLSGCVRNMPTSFCSLICCSVKNWPWNP